MDLRLLHRFIVVAETGSINKAAARLNFSQPALTKSLRLLEERLDVQLVVRGPRGISLTPIGEKTLKHAKLMEAEVRKLDGEISTHKKISMGHVRIGVPVGPGFLTTVLPAAVMRFARTDMRVTLDVTMGIRADLIRPLLHGEIDFLISTTADDDTSAELVREVLYQDRRLLVVAPDHPLAAGSAVSTAELGEYSWVIQKQASSPSDAILDEMIEAEVSRNTIKSNSTQFVKIMMSDHNAIGLLAYDAVRVEMQKGQLVELRVEDRRLHKLLENRTIEISHRRDVPLSSAATRLMRYIKSACRDQYPPVS